MCSHDKQPWHGSDEQHGQRNAKQQHAPSIPATLHSTKEKTERHECDERSQKHLTLEQPKQHPNARIGLLRNGAVNRKRIPIAKHSDNRCTEQPDYRTRALISDERPTATGRRVLQDCARVALPLAARGGQPACNAFSRTYCTPGADRRWRVSSAVRSARMTTLMGSPKNSLRLQVLKSRLMRA